MQSLTKTVFAAIEELGMRAIVGKGEGPSLR